MDLCRSLFASLAFFLLIGSPLLAQESATPGSTAEELIAREQARRAVEDALERFNGLTGRGGEIADAMTGGADELIAAGPDVVPFLVAELELESPRTYGFCAYALGLLGGAEAEAALRAAMKKADMTDGDWAFARKGWAAYGLGLMGVAEAIELVDKGKHRAGSVPVHERMTALEAIAIQTAPESTPLLLRRLDARGEPSEIQRERILVVRALWRVADPASAPKLLELAGTADIYVRNEVLHALAGIGTTAALKAVWATLDDENVKLRTIAVTALERQAADVSLDLLQQRLKAESSAGVRGAIYRMLARRGGPSMATVLVEQWGQPDTADRHQLVRALGDSGSVEALPVLRQALDDPDGSVRTRAVRALGRIGNEQAVELLLGSLRSPDFQMVRAAARSLTELDAEGAGAAIAARLFEVELGGVLRDVRKRSHAVVLAVCLVGLRHHQALDGLKEATARQVDATLIKSLQPIIEQLEAIRAGGDDPARWIELAGSDKPHIRSLAYSRLGQLGGAETAQTLARLFGRVDPKEGAEILRAAGTVVEEPTLALVERVLGSEAFDSSDRALLRAEAAWAARRIGGKRMQRALRQAVERRGGRDAKVLVYLALLARKDALPVLERYRVSRLRYMRWKGGTEMEQLDRVSRWIAGDWSLQTVDLPPSRLSFD